MKKRYLILIAVLALSALFPLSVPAAGTTISVSSAQAAPGETVSLAVTLADNPGFCYLKLTYAYDREKLTFLKAENGTVSTDSFLATDGAFSWDTARDATADGTLVTLTFRVKDSAAGTADVSVDVAGCFNYDEQEVAVTVRNGVISIEGGAVPPAASGEEDGSESKDRAEAPSGETGDSGNTGETREAHVHEWDGGSTVRTATCMAVGVVVYKCPLCGETKTENTPVNPANHGSRGTELRGVKPASATEEGYTGDRVCKDCGAVLAQGEGIPRVSAAHTHSLAPHEAQAPTCTTDGTLPHYACEICGMMFADAEGTEELASAAIPSASHVFGSWTVTRPASGRENGERIRECGICHITETGEIPADG